MNEIKILESLSENLNTNLQNIEYYNYEKHENIAKFVKKFKEENPIIINNYAKDEGLLEEEITLNEIIEIINSQMKNLQEAVKKATNIEYKKVISTL